MKSRIGIIILAAGDSGRLGQAKQLLTIQGKTLIRRMAELAIEAHPERIYVVTGAIEKDIKDELAGLPVTILHNKDWEEGSASSISQGIASLSADGLTGALLMTCDQVKLTSELLRSLTHAYINGNAGICCSAYGNELGIPALFDSRYFESLTALRGDKGAKKIIENAPDKIIIPFPEGGLDIDRPEDLRLLE